MVFKKVTDLLNTYVFMPKLAIYNAAIGDIVCIDDSFYFITTSGFEEVSFIFHLENNETNGI